MMSSTILKSGTLTKRGGGFPYKWQDRTFNLYADRIEYLAGTVLKGDISILHSTTVEKVSTFSDKPYAFQVKTKDSVLLMTGKTEDDSDDWIDAISVAIEDCGEDDSDDESPVEHHLNGDDAEVEQDEDESEADDVRVSDAMDVDVLYPSSKDTFSMAMTSSLKKAPVPNYDVDEEEEEENDEPSVDSSDGGGDDDYDDYDDYDEDDYYDDYDDYDDYDEDSDESGSDIEEEKPEKSKAKAIATDARYGLCSLVELTLLICR